MKVEQIYEVMCDLLQYGSDKGLELCHLVERNYFDTYFADSRVLEAKNKIERDLNRKIEEFETFFELFCAFDEKYHLAYRYSDKIFVDFKEQFKLKLYNVYYIKDDLVKSGVFVIYERMEQS